MASQMNGHTVGSAGPLPLRCTMRCSSCVGGMGLPRSLARTTAPTTSLLQMNPCLLWSSAAHLARLHSMVDALRPGLSRSTSAQEFLE